MQENLSLPQFPARHECPGKFCYHWDEAGTRYAVNKQVFDSLDQMFDEVVWSPPREADGCGISNMTKSAKCTRLHPLDGDADWYEPHEPNLWAAGLPEDHFCQNSTPEE